MSHLKKVCRSTAILLLCMMLLGNVWILFSSLVLGNAFPTIFGCTGVLVKSGSMAPTLTVDDVAVIRAEKTYQVGDIILFQDNSANITFVIHRIVAIDGTEYITRGDANNTNDPRPVSSQMIVGREVMVLRGAGWLIRLIRSPLGLLGIFCLLIITVLIFG